MRNVKLYNILLPLWLLLFWPSLLWLLLIPLNYLIDRIVLKWSLKDMPDKADFCRRHSWKICLAGFLSDFIGMLLLLGIFMCTSYLKDDSPLRKVIGNIEYGIGYSPFSNFFALIMIIVSIAVAGSCIYLFDKKILTKAGLDIEHARSSALKLALITAPYLYLVPTSIIYDGRWF
ncbi:MAG: hypothetical protein IJJ00_07425 [Erysipelotrichaceae bacterium]|nr:hypothetical protein [Erysipelotrichaceae bacterium]